MARSDERAAVQDYMCPCEGVWSGKNIQRWLAAQGLHVVTAADMRVLEAMKKADIRVNDTGYDGPVMPLEDEYAVCEAELARREGKR